MQQYLPIINTSLFFKPNYDERERGEEERGRETSEPLSILTTERSELGNSSHTITEKHFVKHSSRKTVAVGRGDPPGDAWVKQSPKAVRESYSDKAHITVYESGVVVQFHKTKTSRQRKEERWEESNPGVPYPDIDKWRRDKEREKRKKRGKITAFSRSSQQRFTKGLMTVPTIEMPYFISLTFADPTPTPKESKRILMVFLQRLRRHFPKLWGFWKLEVELRKTGQYQGAAAPHFHLLLWGHKNDFRVLKKVIREFWYQAAGQENKNHRRHGTKVMRINNIRGIKIYTKKYLSKTYAYEDTEGIGRTWGKFGDMRTEEPVVIQLRTEEAFKILRALRNQINSNYKKRASERGRKNNRYCSNRKRIFDGYEKTTVLQLYELYTGDQIPF